MTKNILKYSSLCLLIPSVFGAEYLPENLIQTDAYFSHHTLVAEKSTHSLHLFENEDGVPRHVKTFQMATGKKAGDKFFQGDHRTPEGVYHFTQFLTHNELLKRHGDQGKIYGVGAFVMNYPNAIDKREGKTGGGIWLHSTNDETRIEKGLDSRGCIVAHNGNLIDISKYIELNRTSVIVVQDLKYLPASSWKKNKDELLTKVKSWADSWRNEDLENYLSHYSKKEFHDKNRGGFNNFKNYKRAVFANPGKPQVELRNVSILRSEDYAVVTFKQLYTSKTIQDTGKKTLYLKKDQYYKWKIVSEQWSKHGIEEQDKEYVAFQPSQRFFESTSPKQILGDYLLDNQTKKEN